MCVAVMNVCVPIDLRYPVAVVPVYPVCFTQVAQCGQVGHQCYGHTSNRSVNSLSSLYTSSFHASGCSLLYLPIVLFYCHCH